MKAKTGTVVSAKMDKTVVVAIDYYISHPKYKKRYRMTKKFYAHDQENAYQEGDVVEIKETRPMSKLKRWVVVGKAV